MKMYIEFYASLMKYLPPGKSRFRREIKVEDSLILNRVIERNFQDPDFGRQQLANGLAVSERQLNRKLRALIDFKPSDYLREFRLRKAASLLSDGNQVAVVAEQCGYVSTSHFSRLFKAQFGISPKQYQATKRS